ncbi:LOW QUALITY PROTEIN: nuclear pore complex protein NUP98A [Glycine max]|uniref:LOW QUALITY PROTEIN: nuclear pore complex protein NUP98A n=1 Tax=Glycine max TaxID=3847 RepID=UPI000E21BA9C|nr:LOW QUALITY PROTEIN: nuclear pore complex protein NUP98A [Glycine max]|eukprot:XP_006606421.2 LOW QUALITY PROTEIN: nuclear pore complex protein NUP98A [Glycine max]
MATTEADSCTSGSKLESISAMPIYKDKSHEQLRWEDYQLGDKGGHLSIQSTGLTGFSLYQSAANPFSTTTPNSNLFVPKSSPLSSGFGTSAAPAFSLPAFGSSTSAAEPSIFGSTPCPFGANSSSTPSFGQSLSLFNTAPAQATSSPFGRNIFGNTQSSPLFSSAAPTATTAQTGSAFGQFTCPFGQTTPSFSQSSLFNSPSWLVVSIFSSIAALVALQAYLVRITLDS